MNEKTINHAYSVICTLKEQYGVIKDYEIPPLVNMQTGEDVGFAVILELVNVYEYTGSFLKEWKEKFCADEFMISIVHNQLVVKFTIHYEKKTMKCINCNNDVEIDIAKAIDEEGEVFHCPCCGFIFSYTDK